MMVRGRVFNVADNPAIQAAALEFTSGFEEGTLRFFDAALPSCDRFIDFGAYVGFTALYAAAAGAPVFAFEPNPANYALLTENVAANPALAPSVALFMHGVGARDEEVPLFAKGAADSGASVFQDVERRTVLRGRPEAIVRIRAAGAVLRQCGLDGRTLLKIDIEGAEYAVLPAIGGLLAEQKPWLHISFHPFNLAAGLEPYRAALARLRAGLEVAEALACYRFMHVFADGTWSSFGPEARMDLLRHYLLRAKPVDRVASPQYGFVDGVGFSDRALE